MSSRTWSAEEIRALGVRTDLETAASIWGIGRTRAYELARNDEFPCPVVRIGAKYVVLVAPMLRALGIDQTDQEDSEAGSSTEPATARIHALTKSPGDPHGHTHPAA